MMSGPDQGLSEYFRDKRECVIDFPSWLLSPGQADAYRSANGLAMVEIAGRDSVAAAVKAVQDEGFAELLPTYVYTGTEQGDWTTVTDAVARLTDRLPGVRIHPLLAMGSPRFWQAMNGRFMSRLIEHFGFFSPCIGCHLYLHSVRLPLAASLGRVPIIAGERESHDGAVKINQLGEALSQYTALAGEFGVRLLFPLQHIPEGFRIRELLGFEWEEGQEQLGCVLSGNYRHADGSVIWRGEQVTRYLETFAVPVSRDIVKTYLRGDIPAHLKIAGQVLEALNRT